MFSISDPTNIVHSWYSWGVAIAFAISFVTTLWIFFDSQSNGYHAPVWRWLSLISAIVVIPSVILSFSPALAAGLPAMSLNILAVAGMAATVISLGCLLLYGLGVGVMEEVDAPGEDEPEAEAPPVIPGGAGLAQAGVHPTPTPPHGVQPTTREKPVTPQRITPTSSDTVRIKSVYEQELPLAWVVVMNGPYVGREYRLQKITDIGREREHNDVALDDRTISRQHARIRYEKGAFVIYDLASANGVLVNGESVQRRVITHGDRIKLGQVALGVLMVLHDIEPVGAPETPASPAAQGA